MKKRIALAAAIALAISVGGMLPASATKLTDPGASLTDSCVRVGGTLQIVGDNGATTQISSTGTALVVTNADCSGEELRFSASGITTLSQVIVNASANVRFVLSSGSGTLADFHSVEFVVRAHEALIFNGASVTGARAVSGTVLEETFTVGSLRGSYFAGTGIEFYGGNGADVFDASAVETSELTSTGGSGADTIKGGDLDDTIAGGDGDDKLYGGDGDDTLDGDAGDDVLYGEAGDDPHLDGDADAVNGDQAWGGPGNDSITAGTADDVVAPGDGDDVVTLVAGTTLLYADSTAAITVDLEDYEGIVRSSAGIDTYTGGAPAFVGSPFADTMSGADADVDDVFVGGAGADTLIGFDGEDVLVGSGGKDLIKGGDGADTISGNSGADTVYGGEGDDTINGGGGDDILYGANDDDIIRGDKGSDQAWGGKGTFDVCAAEVTDSCEFKK